MYIDLDDLTPDAAGEYLRSKFFPDWVKNGSWEPGVGVEHWFQPEVFEDDRTITVFHGKLPFEGSFLRAIWYWDEDWYLEFYGRLYTLVNDDAKKDHGWTRL